MARKKTGDNKIGAEISSCADGIVNTLSAQADNGIAVSGVKVRRDSSLNLTIDRVYMVEQACILPTQTTSTFRNIVKKNSWSYRRRSIPTKTPYNEVL